MSDLGGLLRRARHKKGWTLRQAAGETGISNGYLSLMEQGRVKAPSPRYLKSLSEKYGLPFVRLMKLAGHPSAADVPATAPQPLTRPTGGVNLSHIRNGLGDVFGASATAAGPGYPPVPVVPESDPVKLAVVLAEDLEGLSPADIAQVRAFIDGIRAARR